MSQVYQDCQNCQTFSTIQLSCGQQLEEVDLVDVPFDVFSEQELSAGFLSPDEDDLFSAASAYEKGPLEYQALRWVRAILIPASSSKCVS